ncbi:MAG: PilZ domain-containing protein [Candidatus Eremiobacteraeota bacterium]|nr:PilZ domain-containing protein [Candidatus Eremiobacteraeota bacterium]
MFSRVGLVEALDLRNGNLTLRSRKRMTLGTRTQVRVQLPPGTGKVVTVPILLESEQALQGGTFLYRAVVDTELPEQLEFRGDDPILRQGRRVDVKIRARAKELPDFQATVTDFSRGGAQLKLSGPIKQKLRFLLNLDLEGFRLDTLAVPVEVARVTAHEDGHECGVRFLPKDQQLEKDLDDLARFVEERASSGLQKLLSQSRLAAPLPETAPRAPVVPPPPPQPVRQDLNLPVQARLDGYSRNLTSGSLFLRFVASDESIHTLEFPACRWLEDRETARCAEVARLQSAALSHQEEERLGPGSWRRYSLLAEDGECLLELVSRACKA